MLTRRSHSQQRRTSLFRQKAVSTQAQLYTLQSWLRNHHPMVAERMVVELVVCVDLEQMVVEERTVSEAAEEEAEADWD